MDLAVRAPSFDAVVLMESWPVRVTDLYVK